MVKFLKPALAGAAILLVLGSTAVALRPSSSKKEENQVFRDPAAEGSQSTDGSTDPEGDGADGGSQSESGATKGSGKTSPRGGTGSGSGSTTKPGSSTTRPNSSSTTALAGGPKPKVTVPKVGPVGAELPSGDAETPSLAAVAGGLSLRSKSVSGVVEVKAGLTVTTPIEISVVYDGFNRISQNYSSQSGNKIRWEWDPTDGKARPQRVEVDLYERHANGEYHSYKKYYDVTITPLYDVTVGQMSFELVTDCDTAGESEPIVYWYEANQSRHSKALTMSAGQTVKIAEFSKAYSQQPLTSTLVKPAVSFQDDDNLIVDMFQQATFSGDGFSGHGSNGQPLLPGKTHLVQFDLNDQRGGDCGAFVKYDMFYNLSKFPTL